MGGDGRMKLLLCQRINISSLVDSSWKGREECEGGREGGGSCSVILTTAVGPTRFLQDDLALF